MKAVRLTQNYIDTNYLQEHQQRLIERRDFTEGSYSDELADQLVKLNGFRYCELFGSASIAMYAAVYAVKEYIDKNKPVQVSSFSFPALYNALVLNDIAVKIIDCASNGLATTQGELTVHQSIGTNTAEINSDSISIEDSAWCFGRTMILQPTFSVMSLGNNKPLNCGSGGALFFNDKKWVNSLRLLKYYGATGRASQGGVKQTAGGNFRFDDWRAIMGLSQICRIQEHKNHLYNVQKQLLVEQNGYSTMHMLRNKIPCSVKSWQPLHTYLPAKGTFPNSEYCYRTMYITGSNYEYYRH